MKWLAIVGFAVLASGCSTVEPAGPKVLYTDAVDVETTKGTFTIELFWSDSPVATTQFVRAVNRSVHKGRPFASRRGPNGLYELVHLRVKKSDKTYPDVVVSREPGFVRGSVGMIRVDRNGPSPFLNYTSGFFICRSRSEKLDLLIGVYTLVGRVTSGMEIVDRLGAKDRVLSVSLRRVRAQHDGATLKGVPRLKMDPPQGAKREREK